MELVSYEQSVDWSAG